jgi:uncharacterized RDD family membrane protein YckC
MKSFFSNLNNKIEAGKTKAGDIRYAGFNTRVYATIIDLMILLVLMFPFVASMPKPKVEDYPFEVRQAIFMYQNKEISSEQFINSVTPYYKQIMLPKVKLYSLINTLILSVILLVLWKYTNGTPGKKLLKLKIVSLKNFDTPTTKQYILRLIGYIIASIPFGLGFIWIAFNKKKQGLHDLISGTTIIHAQTFDPEWEAKKLKYQAIFVLIMMLLVAIFYTIKNS